MDEVFFPGSDDELGFAEEEMEDGGRLVSNNSNYNVDQASYICAHCSDDDSSGDEHGDDTSSGYIHPSIHPYIHTYIYTYIQCSKHEKYLHKIPYQCQFLFLQSKQTNHR